MLINFFSDEGITIPSIRKTIVRQWIKQVISSYGQKLGELSYNFTSDEGILVVNRQFLDHDYYTDIITFDNREDSSEAISGDLVISLETVKSNADMLGTTFAEELHRVLIHGVLHLIGLDDHSDEDRTKMRAAEDKALTLLTKMLAGKSLLR